MHDIIRFYFIFYWTQRHEIRYGTKNEPIELCVLKPQKCDLNVFTDKTIIYGGRVR